MKRNKARNGANIRSPPDQVILVVSHSIKLALEKKREQVLAPKVEIPNRKAQSRSVDCGLGIGTRDERSGKENSFHCRRLEGKEGRRRKKVSYLLGRNYGLI